MAQIYKHAFVYASKRWPFICLLLTPNTFIVDIKSCTVCFELLVNNLPWIMMSSPETNEVKKVRFFSILKVIFRCHVAKIFFFEIWWPIFFCQILELEDLRPCKIKLKDLGEMSSTGKLGSMSWFANFSAIKWLKSTNDDDMIWFTRLFWGYAHYRNRKTWRSKNFRAQILTFFHKQTNYQSLK